MNLPRITSPVLPPGFSAEEIERHSLINKLPRSIYEPFDFEKDGGANS